MSISDSDKTAKKAAETTPTEPTVSKPDAEREQLAEVEEAAASVTAPLPAAERAAAEREMLSGLQRAAAAAERLKETSPEKEEVQPPSERDEGPPSRPKLPTPLPPPFAITSDGKILLNVDACPGLELEGRAIFRAVVLSDEEGAFAMRKFEDVIHDVAGHLGGLLLKRGEPEGSGGDTEG